MWTRAAGHRKTPASCSETGVISMARETVSRVLYLTVIYLGVPLPARSSHPGSGRASLCAPIPVLLRIEFTATDTSEPSGALLPHLSTLTAGQGPAAVSLCCTFPEVAFGGRYPLSLPCGARTFLTTGLSAWPRDCLSYSPVYFSGIRRDCQRPVSYTHLTLPTKLEV